MIAHEGCSELINIDSGANCLIMRLCERFDEIYKNAKSHLSTADKIRRGGGLSMHGVGSFVNVNNVKWCK